MRTNVEPILYKSKRLKNGEYPLMLRITKERKRKYVSLNISLPEEQWDFKKGQPKRNCPNKEKINLIIQNRAKEYEDKILDLHVESKDYTLNTLADKVKVKSRKLTVETYIEQQVALLKSENRLGSAATYHSTLNSLRQFANLDIYFSEIDVAWIKRYETWLRAKGNSENTMGVRFRTLRAIYNKAVEDNVVKLDYYPFDTFKVSRLKKPTPKRALSRIDINRILETDLQKVTNWHSPMLPVSRDIFLFSYFSCGMNLTDIAHLKHENIVGNRIVYERRKTGKVLNFALHPIALEIMECYSGNNPKPSNYVFPILDDAKHKTPVQKRNRILKITKVVNKALHKIGTYLELPITLTTYVARHTYATVLKRSGVNIAIISESLGHSDLATTQIYLDSFENSQIDEAMQNLL